MIASWQERAACRNASDPTQFDPPRYFGRRPEAKIQSRERRVRERYCNHCPVIEQCWQFGSKNGFGGIWGGMMLEASTVGEARPARTGNPRLSDRVDRGVDGVHGYFDAVRRHRQRGEELCTDCLRYVDTHDRGRRTAPCGTSEALDRHRRKGEHCDECKQASKIRVAESHRQAGISRRAPCGTNGAYRRHLKYGEEIDEACRIAGSKHLAEKRQRRAQREAA